MNRKAVEQLASGEAAARGEVERLLLRLTGKSLGRKILDPAWGRLTFSTDPMPAALARIAEDSGRLGFLPAGSKIDGIVATVTTGSAPR